MKWLYRVRLLPFMTCAFVLAGGCGAASPPPASVITGLHFTTSTEIQSNPPPNVDVTLTDPTPSRAIYAATLALPAFPPGTYNCPFDPGIRYSIVFTSAQGDALSVVLNPAGCREVRIPGSSTRRVLDPTYWAVLAQNLGIPEATVYPSSLP